MRVGGALATNVVERVWASPLCDVSFASARIAVTTDRWSATETGGDGDGGGDGGDGGDDGGDKPRETLASFMWGTLPSAAAGAVVRTPDEILELRGQALMQMVAAPAHCLALLAAGDVYAWGSDEFGVCGSASGRGGALYSCQKATRGKTGCPTSRRRSFSPSSNSAAPTTGPRPRCDRQSFCCSAHRSSATGESAAP
jgi:hypothetical protein